MLLKKQNKPNKNVLINIDKISGKIRFLKKQSTPPAGSELAHTWAALLLRSQEVMADFKNPAVFLSLSTPREGRR